MSKKFSTINKIKIQKKKQTLMKYIKIKQEQQKKNKRNSLINLLPLKNKKKIQFFKRILYPGNPLILP